MEGVMCKTCVFFDPAERLCRRKAPDVHPGLSAWPRVSLHDWCGEYRETWPKQQSGGKKKEETA